MYQRELLLTIYNNISGFLKAFAIIKYKVGTAEEIVMEDQIKFAHKEEIKTENGFGLVSESI